jgi:AraC family transcriptional regulator
MTACKEHSMPDAKLSTYERWIQSIAESTPNFVQQQQRKWVGLRSTLVSYTEKQVAAPAFSDHIIVLHLNSIPYLSGSIEGKRAETIVKSGEMSLLAAGQGSTWEWRDLSVCETLYLALDSTFVQQVAEDYTNAKPIEILNQFILRDPQIQYIGLALKTEIESGEPSGSLFGDSLANALTTRLLSYSTSLSLQMPQRGGLSAQQVQLVSDYIQSNLNQDLRLTTIAAVVGLSESHFTRQFKQAMGITPYQYVIQNRVEQAKRLLCLGHLTIQDIALQVGFADQSHLTSQFKRTTGVTPKQFLQQR